MCRRLLYAATLCVSFVASSGHASDLVYTPRNPSFGGNPFYSQHLLGTANANNKFEKPKTESLLKQQDPSKEFERIIQSSLLSRITAQIADQIYGEGARDSGRFVIGNTTVDFQKNTAGTTSVRISDAASGGQTLIEIPTPGY